MNLETLRGAFTDPFPLSVRTLGFGPDKTTFPTPRAHFALDHALPYPRIAKPKENPVVTPFAVERTFWHRVADSGANKDVTILDLFGLEGAAVFRMMHFRPEEFFPDVARRVFPVFPPDPVRGYAGGSIPIGVPIAPASDAGLSINKFGGSARHLHSVLLLKPGAFADALRERWGEFWDSNQIPAWGASNPGLRAAIERTGWTMANDHIARRVDPYIGGAWLAVNWQNLLFEGAR